MRFLSPLVTAVTLAILAASCSDTPSTGTGGSGGEAPAPQQQDPNGTVEDVVATLVERREGDEPVFVADSGLTPESEACTRAIELLRQKSIAFEQHKHLNYTYYLNRLLPRLRRSKVVWVLHDHRLEELDRLLTSQLFDQYVVADRFRGAELTLTKVANRFAGDEAQKVSLVPVTGNSSMVTNVEFTPDDAYMFVTTLQGEVRWFSRTNDRWGTALRLPRWGKGEAGVFIGGESGLIGMAPHPQFAKNHKLYLHYNWQESKDVRHAIVSEWTVDLAKAPGEVTIGGERELLRIEQPHTTHNGGCLKFGPDGMLYIGVGDGEVGKWTVGRSPMGILRGKVLRIDVDSQSEGRAYGIPPDNPFVGDDRFPPETFAWGFRNPWRIAFLPDGRLIAGDIGEDVNEELTFVVRGKHHGWPFVEGSHRRNPLPESMDEGAMQPALLPYAREYGMSVIPGNVYDGEELPWLRGKFVFCDHLTGYVWAIDLPETDHSLTIDDAVVLARLPFLVQAITRDAKGDLYFGAHTGQVMKLAKGSDPGAAAADKGTPADPEAARGLFGAEYPATAVETSPARVSLGRALFEDVRLSGDGKTSCATCHPLDGDHFGQDGRVHAIAGVGPKRNTQAVFDAARQFAQFCDYRSETLVDAVRESLVGHMANRDAASAVARVADAYGAAEKAAFDDGDGELDLDELTHAVAAFVAELNTKSRWERYLDGDDEALTEAEQIGLGEFIQAGCMSCHQFRGLGGGMPQKLGLMQPWQGGDRGRGLIDDTPGQDYFFKVPTLFNVAKTPPYYHDGSMRTLADAVQNMAIVQLGRELRPKQVESIVTFLGALTGDRPAVLDR